MNQSLWVLHQDPLRLGHWFKTAVLKNPDLKILWQDLQTQMEDRNQCLCACGRCSRETVTILARKAEMSKTLEQARTLH